MDQRSLFKQFYARICDLDRVNGKVVGKEVFNLLCDKTLALKSYKEIEHESYGKSAYFGTYLHICKYGNEFYLNGTLLLSMEHSKEKEPIITLQKDKNLLLFNHRFVSPNGIIHTEFLKNWNSHPNVFDCIRDVVDQLQGNPYDYERADSDDDNAGEEEVEPEPQSSIWSFLAFWKATPFNEHIPYIDLKKGALLGQGGFGSVYKAEWNGKTVAMKEWKSELNKDSLKTFQREISIQKNLNHPNCLHVYGLSETPDKRPVLVMELGECSLGDLTVKREINNKRHPERKPIPPLTNEEKCRIILEIAQGIQYIHSCGYIHRDIKLDNILMKDGHPMIADFGLAREYDVEKSMQMTFCGTPSFMPPELILNRKATNTVDCYSFGCVVNEIISEKHCYWDYHFRTRMIFYCDVCKGMTPTILPDTPDEVKYLLKDCYKARAFRPPMKVLVERIQMWEPSKWK